MKLLMNSGLWKNKIVEQILMYGGVLYGSRHIQGLGNISGFDLL